VKGAGLKLGIRQYNYGKTFDYHLDSGLPRYLPVVFLHAGKPA
jgi:hypothetical protein